MTTMDPMAYGDGTINLRADGRLQVRVTVEGKRLYANVPARLVKADPKQARREAERLRRELVEARESGVVPSGLTLAAFLRSWIASLRDAKTPRVRPRTLDHYAMIVENHVIPALGTRRLDRLRESHVQAWIDADPASPQTIHHHRAVLRRALNVAMARRLIVRNPAVNVELPRVPAFRGAPLTLDEARALLAATETDRLGALWRLALDTGLRISELLGLAWDDLDLDAGTVTVRSQLQRRRGQWIRTPTKAARSLDAVALFSDTLSALETHRRKQAAERETSWRYWGLVFLTPTGEPLHDRDVLRAFHDACDRAGIARRRVHDLRGSSATLMRDLGVSEDTRMARLGHQTRSMARRYARSSGTQDRLASDALGEALR